MVSKSTADSPGEVKAYWKLIKGMQSTANQGQCTVRRLKNIDFFKTLMPPFPNICIIGLTFDLDLCPTDLSINRDHLLIKTIYLQSLKLLGKDVLELLVAQG